jgi:hypothetical protein
MEYTGFARADVVAAEPVERKVDTRVILSEPWSPAPWEGDPIRFLLVYGPTPADDRPGHLTFPRLRVRLADGRTYLIES